MKSFITVSAALLATCATALPNSKAARQGPPEVTFALSNDQTGHHASATVPANGDTFIFSSLFGDSVLASDGQVLASSGQLTAFPQGVDCGLENYEGDWVTALTPENTYVDLDGNPNVATPVDVAGYTISCSLA
jgi:hypothetical protein